MHTILKKTVITSASLLFPVALAWAQAGPGGQPGANVPPGAQPLPMQPAPPPPPSVDERFEMAPGQEPDSIVVGDRGNRGKGKHEFKIRKNRGPGVLDLDLDEKGSGKKNKFTYQEGQAITVMVGGQPLNIAFQGQNVQVGAAPPCVSDNIMCIAQAVRGQLPNLTPEDMAAAYAVLRQDLPGVKHGGQIAKVFEALATRF